MKPLESPYDADNELNHLLFSLEKIMVLAITTATSETEIHHIHLNRVNILKLDITPDISGGGIFNTI